MVEERRDGRKKLGEEELTTAGDGVEDGNSGGLIWPDPSSSGQLRLVARPGTTPTSTLRVERELEGEEVGLEGLYEVDRDEME